MASRATLVCFFALIDLSATIHITLFIFSHSPVKPSGEIDRTVILFIRLLAAALFSSNVPISCQFREFLSLINVHVQEHSFHQFQGLRRPREQSILIIHFMRKLRIYLLFRPIGWFWLFYGWKAPKFGKLGVWLLDKNWATLKSPAAGKKANLPRFGALKFWQHCILNQTVCISTWLNTADHSADRNSTFHCHIWIRYEKCIKYKQD